MFSTNEGVENMKKILLFLAIVISLTLSVAYADVDSAFSNAAIEIDCVDGEIVVNGSFNSSSASQLNYRVMLATYAEDGHLKNLECTEKTPINAGTNTFSFKTAITDGVQAEAFLWTDNLRPVCKSKKMMVKSLKIFAIGNSFSVDAMQWLYGIAKDGGYNNIILGNAYISGCTLQNHSINSKNNSKNYIYYKNTTGTWKNVKEKTLLECLTDEKWDIITLQQQSGSSGMPNTYEPYLSELIEFVNTNKTNPYAELVWHMTWAYQKDSTHSSFPNYNNDQLTMYNAIVSTIKSNVLVKNELSYYIPVGTAIQNIRTSFIGDKLTRDGYHLSYDLGRYIAAMTWFHKITGLSIDDITYVPSVETISDNHLKVVKECVKNAVANPDKITQSQYLTENMYDLENYEEIDWEPKASSYYNSTKNSELVSPENSTSSKLKYYIASKIFTKEELPNGTLIVIDEGYQYRPEGWTKLSAINSSSARPANTSTYIVEVSDKWWGNFNYRAFNISVVGGVTDISDMTDEVASHFRIYVPKQK